MFLISVTLLSGSASEVEQRLVERLAIAARSVVQLPPAGTGVVVQHASVMQQGEQATTHAPAAHPVASEVVRAFLLSMQERDLQGASQWLAPDFSMCFPGGAKLHSLQELTQWASGRYRHVAKDFERFEECWTGQGAVVYCTGTLRGTWLDGQEFSGIRFIDRMEVVDGLIQRQDVWNDLAESRARRIPLD